MTAAASTLAAPAGPTAVAKGWRALRTALPRRQLMQALAGLVGGLAVVSVFYLYRRDRLPDLAFGAVMLRAFVAGAAIVAWGLAAHGLLRQNSPVAARLVPGHLACLRGTLVAAWLAATAVLVMAAPSSWWTPLTVAAFAGGLLVYALGLRSLWVWVAAWVLVPLATFGGGRWFRHWTDRLAADLRDGDAATRQAAAREWDSAQQALTEALTGWQPLSVTLLAVALIFGAWLLSRVVRGGGGAHLARPGTTWMVARGGSMSVSTAATAATPFGRALARWSEWPYHAWLARCMAWPSGIGTRVMMVFGPNAHWTLHLTWAVIVLAVVLAALWLPAVWVTGYRDGVSRAGGAAWGPMIGLMSASLGPLFSASVATRRTWTEQSLLRIAPGVPGGAGWGRMLARLRVRQFLLCWAVGATGCAVLAAVTGMPPGTQASAVVGIAAVLPSIVFVFPDVLGWSTLVRFQQLCVAVSVGLPVLAVALHRVAGVPASALVAVMAVATAALCAWRWRVLGRLSGSPPAPLP